MKTNLTLFALFVFLPLVEIFLLIQVGGLIGALPTVGLVVTTAVAGAGLLRQQGLATLARLNEEMGRGVLPAQSLMEGAALLVGGAMLLTPGFLTDAAGLMCLLPPTRRFLLSRLAGRVQMMRPPGAPGGEAGGRVIEGEFDVLRDKH
ncbi:MAG: FxsA family protein [Pseudomonadota bacterium]|nr:FxsA family protein [Pseudomonadota bacterium]